MKAMILAAGKGTRVQPITHVIPKPMIPILQKPVMEFLLELLKEHGFTEVMVNVSHLAEEIENYFRDGQRFGVEIAYSFEGRIEDGELINQLETIAESLKNDELHNRRKLRQKKLTNREIIAQVSSLAHREKLPETTAALAIFINKWEQALNWVDFELLVDKWKENSASDNLDTDRVGVFWALLFLCSQGKVEIDQKGSLFSPISLKRLLQPGMVAQLPLASLDVTDVSPAAA